MADFTNNTVTRAGRDVLAHALATTSPIEFLRVEIGDGEAPEQPEEAAALTNKLTDLAISKLSKPEEGVTTIRAAFKANTVMESFYLREIGIIVKGIDGGEVLFAYFNSGDKADFIPPVGGSSIIEEVLILSIVTGKAEIIFQNFDPTTAATIETVEDAIKSLNVEQIKLDIEAASKEIAKLKQEIEQASKGFVEKDGDEMTGDLKMKNGAKLVGSATSWNGWKIYNSITELNVDTRPVGEEESTQNDLPDDSTIQQIIAKLPAYTKLIHYFPAPINTMPTIGMIDVQKTSADMGIARFLALDGRMWMGIGNGAAWTGWHENSVVPPGTIDMYGGPADATPPLGYIFAHGQYVSRTQYAALFAVYGTYYGSTDSTNFRVPDMRGNFPRGLDNGRGVDSGRKLGSEQADAIRNITFGFVAHGAGGAWGAAYTTGQGTAHINTWVNGYDPAIIVDAARVVPTANENRPRNIALNFIIKY